MSSIEGSQWAPDKSEQSAESDDDIKKKDAAEKRGRPVNSRWVRPPIAGAEGLLIPNQRREKVNLPPRPPLLLEKLDTEKNDEEDEEDAPSNAPVENLKTEAFESAVPPPPEFMDIPLRQEVPFPPETFEDILKREMPPDFIEATSSSEPIVPNSGEIPPPTFEDILRREMPPEYAQATSGETLTDPHEENAPRQPGSLFGSQPATRPFYGGLAPSRPPQEVTPGASTSSPARETSFGGGSEAPRRESRESNWVEGVSAAIDALKAVTDLAELASNPYSLVSRAVMEIAVSGFLEDRKNKRYGGLREQLQRQEDQITQMRQEQRQTNERHSQEVQRNATKQETMQEVHLGPDQQIFDRDGNEITLRPGWRVERSAGGYSVVLDQHNRLVYDAIRYGESYQRDQKREQLSDDVFTAIDSGVSLGTPTSQHASSPVSAAHSQSSTASSDFSVTDLDMNDSKGRSSNTKDHVASIIANPWLWTAIALLIIVYFVAALA